MTTATAQNTSRVRAGRRAAERQSMDNERLTLLEERLAYIERYLDELSSELNGQVHRIDEIFRRLEALGDTTVDAGPADEKPPHY